MKKILVNYKFTPDKDWIGDDYIIYDQSEDKEWLKDFPQDKIIYAKENRGQVDYPKLNYLIDNYDNLPEVFLWGKTNIFKYVSREEYDLVKDNKTFTPLLTQNHRTYQDNNGWVCYYSGGMYFERANGWFFGSFSSKYVNSWKEWCHMFMLPDESYIPFAPGGNYILTREVVHRYSKDFYQKMADTLPYQQLPVEAYCAERSYYYLWR